MNTANRLVALSVVLSLVLAAAGSDVTIYAKEGDDAVLPCRPESDRPENLEGRVFDWKKGRQDVFFHNNGQHYGNTLMGQDDQFKGRVSLPQGGLQDGSASIILSNVTKEDDGEYTCVLLPRNKRRTHVIKLKIVVVETRLKLAIVEAPKDSGWARLSCVSKGGLPLPSDLVWLHQNGTQIPAEGPLVNLSDSSPSISRSLIVTTPGNYTCMAVYAGFHPAANETIEVFGNWQWSTCPVFLWTCACLLVVSNSVWVLAVFRDIGKTIIQKILKAKQPVHNSDVKMQEPFCQKSQESLAAD